MKLVEINKHSIKEIKNNQQNKNGNVGFLRLLGLLFIGLKLTDHITWSWLWVLAPIWSYIIIESSIFLLAWLMVKLEK